MGLFAPKWKSGNSRTACRALERMKDGEEKRNAVRTVLKEDRRQDVRNSALFSVRKDEPFLRELYETSGEEPVREKAFFFMTDREYKKEKLLAADHPRYWMIMYLPGEKDFAYALLSGRERIGAPDDRFWFETVRIIQESYDETDRDKLLEILRTTDSLEIIKNICQTLNFKRETDALIDLAGRGLIGPKRFFDGVMTTWDREDWIKKCARDLLIKNGYTSPAWNEPRKA